MMRKIWINLSALMAGLFFGMFLTLAAADPAPCDCVPPVDRQLNGLPK